MKKQKLIKIINDFVRRDRGNSLPGAPTPIFETPLVAFAAAEDPLFERLRQKEAVGPGHRTPAVWLPNARTVISYSLPISSEIIETNYAGVSSSEEWLYARFHGEDFNNRLRNVITAALRAEGYDSIAPLLSPAYAVADMKSNWSERHAAFIAGLGTFGLNRGIITEKGLAGRIGSVITTLELEPTVRPYIEIYEYCPWFSGNTCGACIKRCPSGALSTAGKDLARCNDFLKITEGKQIRARYGFPFSPCSKCFVNVPCQKRIPSFKDPVNN
ncbi:MAG: epoxyqueuosine reductase [Bacillota bacterium]